MCSCCKKRSDTCWLYSRKTISCLGFSCKRQVFDSPEVRNMLCPIVDLDSDDESAHGTQPEEQVHNDDVQLHTNGSDVQPVSCDHAAEEHFNIISLQVMEMNQRNS